MELRIKSTNEKKTAEIIQYYAKFLASIQKLADEITVRNHASTVSQPVKFVNGNVTCTAENKDLLNVNQNS